ncbi:uncharacterized protein N7459_008819 [Penicillium hispanicum]|uniref:uncharacterized protein n=1 Tax=Penicillium hispanicum TaxID=1080232 RepID=UPI002540BADB|nr:uncharacterized protein N7459_008819 [Penicillium hispanicum]KAJ5574392.1 hypothetical protein N7459_008819 [Penicillium hispanicum]
MGKAGRVACIFTPYVLTIAALICIVMVGLGCTKASSSTLDNLYFIRVNLQNISQGSKTTEEVETILNKFHITSVTSEEVENLISDLQKDSTLKDFYSIGLWGYCDGDISNNKYTTDECSSPKSEFYFDPLKVWGLDNSTSIKDDLPDDYNKLMKVYKSVSKWMFIAYMIAFVTTIVELVVGVFAICSRWGSCVTTLFAVLAFLFTTAASVTSTVLFSIFRSAAGKTLEAYGIKLSMGKNMYAATWLAVVFSLAGVLFWTFSVCCCSGRSPYNHRNRNNRGGITAEKAPYTYEPIGAGSAQPYPAHTSYPPPMHGNAYPMTNTNHRTNSYEPFRHV